MKFITIHKLSFYLLVIKKEGVCGSSEVSLSDRQEPHKYELTFWLCPLTNDCTIDLGTVVEYTRWPLVGFRTEGIGREVGSGGHTFSSFVTIMDRPLNSWNW